MPRIEQDLVRFIAKEQLFNVFFFLRFFFFDVDCFFKVFIEFVTMLLLFYILFSWLQGMWDLSSPTRD